MSEKGEMEMEAEYRKKEIPKILIVDDISVNLEIMQAMIEEEGYETLCAMSVQEAIDIIKDTMPSLILSDLSMPGVDGLEFCRMLKSSPITREIPFIFISVLDSSEEKEQAFLAGAADFILKPYERVEVVMRVNNQLNSYRMKQEMAEYNRVMHKLVEEQKKQIEKEQENVLLVLAKVLKKRDAGRRGNHIANVGYNCKLLAQSLQFLPEYEKEISDEFVETIELAAMLHDIGSLVIPNSAFLKEKNPDEWMLKHAEEGAAILEEICIGQKSSRFLTMATKIVRYHHANWDGSGYPQQKGKEIPLEARITTLANDFDFLIGKREQREDLSITECIELVDQQSGKIYDPDIVKVFDKVWRQMKVE